MTKRIFAAIMALALILCGMPVLHANAEETTPVAGGTTYYVSSLNGETGNSGTSQDEPFASLLEINKITLQPGDRVLLERGSVFVDEYLHVKGSGSEDAPIIIDVYGDESQPKPLIQTNGNGVWYQDYGKRLDNVNHQNKGNVSSCILLYDVEYIEISNIAMTNEGNYAEGEVYNSAYRMDRTGVAGVAENIGTVDHVYLRNLDIRNVEGNVYNKHMCNGGIYFVCHKADDEAATGVARYDDILIESCRLDEVNRWGIAVGYTAYWDGIPYGLVIPEEAITTYGSTNVVIRNNYLTNVGGDGITTMYCHEPLIEYNVLDGYCQDITPSVYQHAGSRSGMVAAGIWPWMCKTPIFQYNECYTSTYNQDGQAWDADWGDNCVYQYNYSCNNAGGAIMFCGSYAANTVFRYNISQDDLSGVLNITGSPNGEVYNNVFFMKEGVYVNRLNMSGGRGNYVANNIFYYNSDTPASAALSNWNDIEAQWCNNIYYNFSAIPNDDGAITADPLFVDPGKGPTGAQSSGLVHDLSAFEGYMLQENSPAINAGVPVENSDIYYNSGKDFFGNELDLIPDIGAYEAGTFNVDASKVVVVNVEMGETVTINDLTGDFSDVTPVVTNAKIASLAMTGSNTLVRIHGEAVTTLADGKYIIVNNRANKTLTNADAAQEAEAGAMNGLSLNGTKESIADNAVWTVAASSNGYTLQDADGKYLTISSNDADVVAGESVVNVVYSNGNWTLSQNGAYLNDAANKAVCASGWQDSSAATDAGSLWTIYPFTEETVSSTELTFTGLYPGSTNIVVGDTLYLVRVNGQLEEVELAIGETATYIDETGNYSDADTGALDTDVATVKLSGAMTEQYTLGAKVTSLTSGNKYILVNTRSTKPVTNAPATAGAGLSLAGVKEDAAKAAVWTITASGNGYTVQDLDGNYMTIGANTAGIVADPAVLTLNYNGSTWTLSQNGAYLNHFGGSGSTRAAGWQDGSAAGDSGSQWDIYAVTASTEENATKIEFTGVAKGETDLQIGDVMYHITVACPCTDTDPADHFCDLCGEPMSECADTDRDHLCNICGKVATDCIDVEPKDNKCDICGEPMDQTDAVIRLAGANRYATALMAADEMKAALNVEKFDAIIIASGNDFADALAGSYLATVKNAPILLSYGGTSQKYAYLDTDNIDYVKANLKDGGTVYILGGKNAVPELYETGLEGYDVVRLGGANRFETNIMILEEAGIANGAEVLVCTATNFADSLSASATGMPILLVWNEKSILYGNQPEFLAGLKEKGCTFTILGGESAVSAKLAETIAAYGEVDRLAGKNRMETSVLVAQKYFDAPETAVVAYAWNYPDGLCGGSLAYALKAPLILTMPKYESAAVEYAAENDITIGYVLGGEKLVTDEIVRSIFAMDATDDIIVKN